MKKMEKLEEETNTPEPSEPIDSVLDGLVALWIRLQHHQNSETAGSMLEKYHCFIHHSERQRACTFAIKSKQLFLLCDWQDTQMLLLKLLEDIRKVKGYEDFGIPKEDNSGL